jgi:hypothetical protein
VNERCAHTGAVPVETGDQVFGTTVVAALCPTCGAQLPVAWLTCDHDDTIEIPALDEHPPYTQICNGCGATFREES